METSRQEGKEEGLVQGRQEGLQQGEINIVLRLLDRRVGTVPAELAAQVEASSLEQLEALGEALLDFEGIDDLVRWLEQNG